MIDFCQADRNLSRKGLASYFQRKKGKSEFVRRSLKKEGKGGSSIDLRTALTLSQPGFWGAPKAKGGLSSVAKSLLTQLDMLNKNCPLRAQRRTSSERRGRTSHRWPLAEGRRGAPLFDQPNERGLVLEQFAFHVFPEKCQVAL